MKALLEGGTFLQPPLLQQVVEKVADFVKSCGLVRYNRFALPLLSFIRKCVGVSQLELESMANTAGISEVLFEHWSEVAGGNVAIPVVPATTAAVPAGASSSSEAAGPERSSADDSLSTHAAAVAAAPGSPYAAHTNKGFAQEASCVREARRSSRLNSETGSAAAAAGVPPIPIDAAAAAAAADIEHAVQSAPASQRAAAASQQTAGPAVGSVSLGGAKSVRVRVPGVAGHIEVVTTAPSFPAVAAAAAGQTFSSSGSNGVVDPGVATALAVPKLELRHHGMQSATAVPEEPLPDLGDDETGQPLSRRARQLEGLTSWSGPDQPGIAEQQRWQQPAAEQHDADEGDEQHQAEAGSD